MEYAMLFKEDSTNIHDSSKLFPKNEDMSLKVNLKLNKIYK